VTARKDPEPVLLLVEDNATIAHLRAEMFERLGCEVRTAATAGEALEQLNRGGPLDLLVADINLGEGPRDQSGLEVVRRAAEMHADLPIVVYTAAFSESELEPDSHPEVSRWLVKGSLGVADLEAEMEDVVQLARRARAARRA
jgi:CheY-like chemotaxis protein